MYTNHKKNKAQSVQQAIFSVFYFFTIHISKSANWQFLVCFTDKFYFGILLLY